MNVARYEEVARSLARSIEDATYPVGSKLPTEVELAEAFAVSRATVRSALDSLERLGMISRRRRVGTRVEAVRPTTGYARTVTTMNELIQYSAETRRKVLGRDEVVADEVLAGLIGCAPSQRWAHVRMLRLAALDDEAPLCHTDVYLDPDIAEVVADRIARPDGLINEIVEQRTGRMTDRVVQTIHACAIGPDIATHLDAVEGEPALQIVRSYVEASGRVGQVTVSVHPAGRFAFTVTMARPRN